MKTMMVVGGVALVASVFAVAGAPRPVLAYSASDNGGPGLQFQGIFSPFENFINSVHLVGAPVIRVGTPPSGILPPAARTGAQNALQQFDGWLYGIAGFHVAGLLTTVLGVFSWILGVVKGAVDWLLGLFH